MKINSFNNLKLYFYFTLWIFIWLSIGINPEQIELFLIDLNKLDIRADNLIKALRIIIPLILSIFLLFIFIKKINYNKNFFYSNFSILLINLFILTQLISLIVSDNSVINIYWIYQSLISLILVYLISNENFSYSKIVVNLSIIILSIVLIRYTIPFFKNFFSSHLSFYNMWPVIFNHDFSLPRPTGLARTSLILLTFFLVFEFKDIKLKIVSDVIIILCSLIIILFQSRTILFLWPLTILIYLFYSKTNKITKFKKLIIYIFLPFLLFVTLNYSRYLISHTDLLDTLKTNKIINKSYQSTNNTSSLGKKNNNIKPNELFRDTDPKSFSSFRTLHWKNIFNDTKKNFMGHGPMGDRYIIDMSASSLFLYALASSGYIGLILIILLSLRSAYLVIYFIFLKKIIFHSQDYYLIFSCLILIILFLRGILETSLGIFSIDYMLFITASLICEINYFNYKKNKNLKK